MKATYFLQLNSKLLLVCFCHDFSFFLKFYVMLCFTRVALLTMYERAVMKAVKSKWKKNSSVPLLKSVVNSFLFCAIFPPQVKNNSKKNLFFT